MQRIVLIIFVALAEPDPQPVAHLGAPAPVADAALQDGMKQRSPFLLAAVGVAPDQLQHRVLHDVERIVGIAEGEPCRQKRAPLSAGEKTFQGFRGLQRFFLY